MFFFVLLVKPNFREGIYEHPVYSTLFWIKKFFPAFLLAKNSFEDYVLGYFCFFSKTEFPWRNLCTPCVFNRVLKQKIFPAFLLAKNSFEDYVLGYFCFVSKTEFPWGNLWTPCVFNRVLKQKIFSSVSSFQEFLRRLRLRLFLFC